MSFTKTYQTERTLANFNESKKTGLNQSPSLGPTQSHMLNQSKYSSDFTSEYHFTPHPIPHKHSNRQFENTLSGIKTNFASILNDSSGLELQSRRRKDSQYYKMYPAQRNMSSTQNQFMGAQPLNHTRNHTIYDQAIMMNRSSSVSFQSASASKKQNYNLRKKHEPSVTVSIIDQEDEQRKEKLYDYEVFSHIVDRDVRDKVVDKSRNSDAGDGSKSVFKKRAKSTFSVYGPSPSKTMVMPDIIQNQRSELQERLSKMDKILQPQKDFVQYNPFKETIKNYNKRLSLGSKIKRIGMNADLRAQTEMKNYYEKIQYYTRFTEQLPQLRKNLNKMPIIRTEKNQIQNFNGNRSPVRAIHKKSPQSKKVDSEFGKSSASSEYKDEFCSEDKEQVNKFIIVQESEGTMKSNIESQQFDSSYLTNTNGQVDINVRTNASFQLKKEQLITPTHAMALNEQKFDEASKSDGDIEDGQQRNIFEMILKSDNQTKQPNQLDQKTKFADQTHQNIQPTTMRNIDLMSKTQLSFKRNFPEFKRGITPLDHVCESSMITQDAIAHRNYCSALKTKKSKMRPMDYHDIKERQVGFKDMMETERSLGIQRKSDILPIESTKSSQQMRLFPFTNNNQSAIFKAYNKRFPSRGLKTQESNKPDQNDEFNIELGKFEKDLVNEQTDLQSMSADSTQPRGKPMTQKVQVQSFMHKIQNCSNQIQENKQQLRMLNFLNFATKESYPQNIEQVANKLGDNFMKHGLKQYKEIKDKDLHEFAQHIQIRKEFFDTCKDANSARIQEAMVNDPQYVFYNKCRDLKVPVLSLLQKRQGKTLSLRGYFLSQQACAALGDAFKKSPEYVDSVILENNGILDKGMAQVMKGLLELYELQKLVVVNNQIKIQSIGFLERLLDSQYLQELRINNCKMTPKITDQLLETILERSQLQRLGLIKSNLQEQSVEKICNLVQRSMTLTDLDISWNGLLPQAIRPLVSLMRTNRRLSFLNLSWNCLKEQRNLGMYDKEMIQDPDKDLDYETISSLCALIKYNSKMLFLDLSQTGLSREMLLEFGPALRKAKSLLSLHLSGNPGIDRDNQLANAISERAHCQPQFNQIIIDEIQKDNVQKTKDGLVVQNKLNEGLKQKRIKAQTTRAEEGRITSMNKTDQNKLIFDRILGHQRDIPGSGQFRMLNKPNENCWITEGHIYTIIFWTRSIGFKTKNLQEQTLDVRMIESLQKLQDRMDQQFADGQYKNQDHINSYNLKLGRPGSSQDVPVIQGPFTNWSPVKMLAIQDYCDCIDKTQSSSFEKMKEHGTCRPEVLKIEEMNDQEKTLYEELQKPKLEAYLQEWNTVIDDSLLYQQPNFINLEHLLEDPDKIDGSPIKYNKDDPIFVFPCYMKPGKHYFVIRQDQKLNLSQGPGESRIASPKISAGSFNTKFMLEEDIQEDSDYFIHSTFVPARLEQIPIVVKQYNTKTTEIVFDKSDSVFKEWKEDTETSLEKSVTHDMERWKLAKFCKPATEAEQMATIEVVKKHMDKIKMVHVFYASKSNYPYLKNDIFEQEFIKNFELTDKNLTNYVNSFKAASVADVQKDTQNTQKNQLLRFQFIEVLMRIGDTMYRANGKESRTSQAFEKFMENNFLPHCPPIVKEYERWRKDKLYTLEVNKMIMVNQANIDKLMKSRIGKGAGVKQLEMTEAIEIFSKESEIVTDKEALFCYGMSKMPVTNETKENHLYKRVQKGAEFYELIGRVAELKYKDMSRLLLDKKIGMVLDAILPLIKAETIEPPEDEDIEESCSDEDY